MRHYRHCCQQYSQDYREENIANNCINSYRRLLRVDKHRNPRRIIRDFPIVNADRRSSNRTSERLCNRNIPDESAVSA